MEGLLVGSVGYPTSVDEEVCLDIGSSASRLTSASSSKSFSSKNIVSCSFPTLPFSDLCKRFAMLLLLITESWLLDDVSIPLACEAVRFNGLGVGQDWRGALSTDEALGLRVLRLPRRPCDRLTPFNPGTLLWSCTAFANITSTNDRRLEIVKLRGLVMLPR